MKPFTIAFALSKTAALVFSAAVARQESDDTPDLYLCSNPNFNQDCQGCACESLTDVITFNFLKTFMWELPKGYPQLGPIQSGIALCMTMSPARTMARTPHSTFLSDLQGPPL
ncbi:hypothetical protein F4776DRAFT_677484 [Hypoxylon sp. NC0597]|nr:hypothetical protein F4776DRAFT_677484 [Hypoxylon sp. NC0597]